MTEHSLFWSQADASYLRRLIGRLRVILGFAFVVHVSNFCPSSPEASAARRTTTARATSARIQHGKQRVTFRYSNNLGQMSEILVHAFGCLAQGLVLRAARAASALAVLRHRDPQSIGAQVRDLAQKIHGLFRVATFEFAVCRAHAAQRGDAAIAADALACVFDFANIFEARIPPFSE